MGTEDVKDVRKALLSSVLAPLVLMFIIGGIGMYVQVSRVTDASKRESEVLSAQMVELKVRFAEQFTEMKNTVTLLRTKLEEVGKDRYYRHEADARREAVDNRLIDMAVAQAKLIDRMLRVEEDLKALQHYKERSNSAQRP